MAESINDLLAELETLERELHRPDTRGNRDRLEQLLHPDFVEFGKSGHRFDRAAIITALQAEPAAPNVWSTGYELVHPAKKTALLTYITARRQADGTLRDHARRSSLWVWSAQGWRMLFHQGTSMAEAEEIIGDTT